MCSTWAAATSCQVALLSIAFVGRDTSILGPCSRRLSIVTLWLILRAVNMSLKIRQRHFIICKLYVLQASRSGSKLRVDWCTLDIAQLALRTRSCGQILTDIFMILFRSMSSVKFLRICMLQSKFSVEIWIFVFFRNE